MDVQILQRIKDLEDKLDNIFLSVERTRKYFKWTLIITIAFVVLPLVGLVFAVPSFFTNYNATLQGF